MSRQDDRNERTKSIMSHVAENVKYTAFACPWHFNNACFGLTDNTNGKRYHCLYAFSSRRWKSYSFSGSCEIPDHFFDLLLLKQLLGSEYVLPFVKHIRERSGYTIGFYELKPGLYNAKILKPQHLAETFYALVFLLCAVSKRLGGHPPVLKRMYFIYTEQHPVLVDIGEANSKLKEHIGQLECTNRKKWLRFMKKRTTLEVTRYLKLTCPQFFKKKSKAHSKCILSNREYFNDETHKLICECRKSSFADVLKNHIHLMPEEKNRKLIEHWLDEMNTRDELIEVEEL